MKTTVTIRTILEKVKEMSNKNNIINLIKQYSVKTENINITAKLFNKLLLIAETAPIIKPIDDTHINIQIVSDFSENVEFAKKLKKQSTYLHKLLEYDMVDEDNVLIDTLSNQLDSIDKLLEQLHIDSTSWSKTPKIKTNLEIQKNSQTHVPYAPMFCELKYTPLICLLDLPITAEPLLFNNIQFDVFVAQLFVSLYQKTMNDDMKLTLRQNELDKLKDSIHNMIESEIMNEIPIQDHEKIQNMTEQLGQIPTYEQEINKITELGIYSLNLSDDQLKQNIKDITKTYSD